MAIFPSPSDNITRPYELLTYANTVTDSLFGAVILLTIFIIALIALKRHPTSAAFAAAAFITTVFAILFRIIAIISDLVLFSSIIITAAALAFLIFEKKQ